MSLPDELYYTRHRTRSGKKESGYGQGFIFDDPSGSASRISLTTTEETWDQESSWHDFRQAIRKIQKTDPAWARKLKTFDMGGPFYNKKDSVELGERHYDLAHDNGYYKRYYGYSGPLVAGISTDSAAKAGPFLDSYDASNEVTLDGLGATAISRCAPSSPHAQVYSAIGELRNDGLPAVPGLTALNGGGLASEYLNFVFGVQPTISDIRKIYSSLKDTEKILKQYIRDSGRLVRRSYSFPVEEKVISTTTSKGVLPNGPGSAWSNSYLWQRLGDLTITTLETREVWFSGAFMYYAADPSGNLGKIARQIQKANHLLGIAPTPSAIWELQPWSWAVDWVTNIGDVLNNVSMFLTDGMIMPYGYVMEHKLRTIQYTYAGGIAKTYGGGTTPVTLQQSFYRETKRRRPATPFGFGLELGDFSPRQWAILAALGATQGGRLFS